MFRTKVAVVTGAVSDAVSSLVSRVKFGDDSGIVDSSPPDAKYLSSDHLEEDDDLSGDEDQAVNDELGIFEDHFSK
jgi:hypothetical protein